MNWVRGRLGPLATAEEALSREEDSGRGLTLLLLLLGLQLLMKLMAVAVEEEEDGGGGGGDSTVGGARITDIQG